MDFSSAAELLKICQASGIPISQAMIDRETLYLGADTVTTYSRMEHSYEIMKNAVHSAVTEDIRSIGGLIGGEAKKMDAYRASTEKPLCGSVISKAIGYAMGVLEVNASMGLIVAAPTAGSSGVIPGVFVALQEEYGFTDDQMVRALFNAGAIGYLITRNATVAGAEGGCQAEVGAASAMAASAACGTHGRYSRTVHERCRHCHHQHSRPGLRPHCRTGGSPLSEAECHGRFQRHCGGSDHPGWRGQPAPAG